MNKYRFIEKEEAIAALPNRDTIHCFGGSFGADWSRDDVKKEIERAEKIAFTPNFFSHELAIEPSKESGWDGVLRFDIKATE